MKCFFVLMCLYETTHSLNASVVAGLRYVNSLLKIEACRSAFYHIRAMRHIRRTITDDVAKTIACSFVTSRLDYVNFGKEGRTYDPLLPTKFHLDRCNVSPLWGEKTQNRPVSKNNTVLCRYCFYTFICLKKIFYAVNEIDTKSNKLKSHALHIVITMSLCTS